MKGFFRALEFTLPRDVDGVRGRHAGRHRRPRGVDGRRPDAARHAARDDPDDARQAEWRRGTLPPGQLGWRRADEIREQAALLATTAQQYRRAQARAYDVDIDLGCGRRLTGTVSPVYGQRLVSVTYSKLDGKHLLESWIPLLALIVARSQPRLVGGVHRAPQAGQHAAAGGYRAPQGDAARCCASWWRSTTRPPRADSVAHRDVLRVGGRAALR